MRLSPRVMVVVAVAGVLLSLMILGQASGATRAEKRAQIQSDLKNAATAEESYFTRAQVYTRVLNELKDEGYHPYPNVRVMIVWAGEKTYCLEAQHDGLGEIWHYNANRGQPVRGRC